MNTDEMKQAIKDAVDLLDENELKDLLSQLCPEYNEIPRTDYRGMPKEGCNDSRGCGCNRCRDLYGT